MKVQTSDDGKLNNGDEKRPAEVALTRTAAASGPYTIDYEIKPSPQAKYVNLSKLVLLVLAIIATFLACLIFARDLWGQKNVGKSEIEHHHASHLMGHQSRFPFEDILDDMEEPFKFMERVGEPNSVDEEPHLVKSAKITVRLIPKDGENGPIMMKKIGSGGPDMMDDGFMNEILKNVMDMMNGPEERRQQPDFGDLPFFDGPNNPRPVHPKLIILRRLPPAPQPEDEAIKNFLAGLNGPPVHVVDKKPPMEPFPLFPIFRPIPRIDDAPKEIKAENVIDRILRDFGLGGPMGRIVVRKKIVPLPSTTNEMSGMEGWTKYKSLVSKLAQEVDGILDSTSTLKQTIVDQLKKMDAAPEGTQGSDAPKPENPAKAFLSSSLDYLNKIGVALTEVSIIIKTEDGAMDLVNKTDKKTLVSTVQSFLKALNGPLGEVFATSTALTKSAGRDGSSAPVLGGIVGVASRIVDFGKIVYEDISKLPSAVSEDSAAKVPPVIRVPDSPQPVPSEPKPQPENAQSSSVATADQPEKDTAVVSAEPIQGAQSEAA